MILKHISEMLCLLISYSKFTRPIYEMKLNKRKICDTISILMIKERGNWIWQNVYVVESQVQNINTIKGDMYAMIV